MRKFLLRIIPILKVTRTARLLGLVIPLLFNFLFTGAQQITYAATAYDPQLARIIIYNHNGSPANGVIVRLSGMAVSKLASTFPVGIIAVTGTGTLFLLVVALVAPLIPCSLTMERLKWAALALQPKAAPQSMYS